MVAELKVYKRTELDFAAFLEENDYFVEKLTSTVFKVERSGELAVFVHARDNSLYFEMDLGSLTGIGNTDLYMEMLNLNTEILPVSVGIDSTHPEDPRLVLLESREADNLDENELLSVMGALELAADKVAIALQKYV